jgi:hypothetical protein
MKTTITDLRAELEVRRSKVAKAEADLAKVKEEAKSYVRIKVEAVTEAVVKARREEYEYVAEIAKTLGRPNPAAAREARARKKRLKMLVREGMSLADAALELQITPSEAEQILAHQEEEKSEPTEGDRGWKRARVLQLLKEGRTLEEISYLMVLSRAATRSHVQALTAQGKWQAKSSEEDDELEGTEDDEPAEVASSTSSSRSPAEQGDSLADLKAEVSRQQGVQRSKAVRFVTVGGDGRQHVVLVDRFGDGSTQPDDSGSVHRVYRFVVNQAKGHSHGLKALGGPASAGA